jgi:hypothetical protein
MLGSEILDVAVGVIFVFLLVSLIASAIREGLEGWLKTRASHLEAGIRELLQEEKDGKGLTAQLFNHPLIYSLYSGDYSPRRKGRLYLIGGGNLPTYIPSRNFALALMDMAAHGPANGANDVSTPISLESLRASVKNIPSVRVQRVLLNAIDTAQGDLQKAQANIEAWYDSAMDRVSGWYKRSTQWILFGIGLSIAALMNVNAIGISNYLYNNKTARETMVAHAQSAASDPQYLNKKYSEIKDELQSTPLPIGWTDQQKKQFGDRWYIFLGGWLSTALAASLGAPFWFDMLNRIMVIRSTVKPHQKSPEEASEDRQEKAKNPAPPPANGGGQPSGAQMFASPPAPLKTADHDQLDGCDVKVLNVTRDEDLPTAEGGIA